MAMTRRALVASALVLTTATLVGCAEHHANVNAVSTHRAIPLPTQKPCVAPTASDFAALASESSAVVEATIGNGAANKMELGTGSSALTVYQTPLTAVKVLSRLPKVSVQAAAPTAINGVGFSWSDTLAPGRYLLFVLANGEPTEGLYGIFDITDGTLSRRCPNYRDPDHPLMAKGTPPAVSVAEAEIPTTIEPVAVPSKPPWARQP
jgi:hypothetical protein